MKAVVQGDPLRDGAKRHPGRYSLAADPHATVMAPFRPAALPTATLVMTPIVPQIVPAIVAPVVATVVTAEVTMVAATKITAVVTAVAPVVVTAVIATIDTIVASAIITVVKAALGTVAVIVLSVCTGAGTKRSHHKSCCSDDLSDLHVSSSRARISGLGSVYARTSASFLNEFVGQRTANHAPDALVP